MIDFPDRLAGLTKLLEAGDPVTPQDVARVAALQALDLAKVGQDFARETCQANDQQTEELRKALANA